MAHAPGREDNRRIALLKNSDASIATLPEDTYLLQADLAKPGLLETPDLAGYRDTIFISYSTALGAEHPDFFKNTSADQRIVWLPASGFMEQMWHDGPLVVIEKDGLVSSYVPTGASAVLLLAPDSDNSGDKKPPIGKPKEQALSIEGPASLTLLRGSVAATRAVTDSIKGNLHITLPGSAQANAPIETIIQLTLLRTASEDRAVIICAPDDAKPNPQLRRLCENTGISWSSWDEPDATLDQLFFWYDHGWNKHLLAAINANGPVIPGV